MKEIIELLVHALNDAETARKFADEKNPIMANLFLDCAKIQIEGAIKIAEGHKCS